MNFEIKEVVIHVLHAFKVGANFQHNYLLCHQMDTY